MGWIGRAAIAGAALLGLGGAGGAQGLGREESQQLVQAAGLRVEGGVVVNGCGHPSNPLLKFVDLNGDGRNEVITLDHDVACYGPLPGYQSRILAKGADGRWRLIGTALGIHKPLPSRTRGWQDFTIEGPGAMPVWRYDGREYLIALAGPPGAAARPAPPLAAGAAFVPSGPTPSGPTPSGPSAASAPVPGPAEAGPVPAAPSAASAPAALSAAEQDALFRAAGAERKGGRWLGCADGGPGDLATIDTLADLNGDGQPEAVVSLPGIACWGHTEQGYAVLTRQPDGRWRMLSTGAGIAVLLPGRGAQNMPDIEVGGPGFCFPVLRWNGRAYAEVRWQNDGKPCRPPR